MKTNFDLQKIVDHAKNLEMNFDKFTEWVNESSVFENDKDTLISLFEQDGVSLSNWTNKSRKHIADLAEAVFDKPSDAHNALTKGQGLFKQRSVETFELCKIIFREAKKKKNN